VICSHLPPQSLSTANRLDGVAAIVTFSKARFSFQIRLKVG
jgi:hypothetical protein